MDRASEHPTAEKAGGGPGGAPETWRTPALPLTVLAGGAAAWGAGPSAKAQPSLHRLSDGPGAPPLGPVGTGEGLFHALETGLRPQPMATGPC